MDYPIKKGTPAKPMKNAIFPQANGKKKNPGMEKSLFSCDENKVDGATGYGKKGKKGTVNKGVVAVKKNVIGPTSDY